MAQTLRTYSPKDVEVNWGGYIPIKNFADGTAIEVSRNSPNSLQAVGMQGDVGLTYNADKTGQISFTIMQTGATNRTLSAAQAAQDLSGQLIRADITISDPSGSFICFARNCHIMEVPTVTLGDDQSPKTWTFFAERIDFTDAPIGFVGAANEVAKVVAAVGGIKNASEALNRIL